MFDAIDLDSSSTSLNGGGTTSIFLTLNERLMLIRMQRSTFRQLNEINDSRHFDRFILCAISI